MVLCTFHITQLLFGRLTQLVLGVEGDSSIAPKFKVLVKANLGAYLLIKIKKKSGSLVWKHVSWELWFDGVD